MGSDATSTVKILLNASGQAQVVGAFNQISAVVSRLSGVLAVFGVSLSAGALVNSLVNIAEKAIDTADAMGKAAQKAGQSVQEFSALAGAGQLAELSQEQLVNAMRALSQEMVKQGNSSGSLNEELLKLTDQFAAMPDGPAKVALAVEKFGRSGQAMIPLLNQGSAALRAQFEEMKRLGLVIGPEFAANADEFNDRLNLIQMNLRGIALQVADSLLPELLRLLQMVMDLEKQWNVHGFVVEFILGQYRSLAMTIQTMLLPLQMLGAFLGTVSGAMAGGATVAQAWEQALNAMNDVLDADAARMKELQELGRRTDDLGKITRAADTAASKEQLETARKLLDIRIAEQRYIIEKTRLESEQRGFVTDEDLISLRTANAIMADLINQKRQLTSDAFFSGAITGPEFQQFETQDRTALLGTNKTAFDSRFADTSVADQMRKAMEDLRREFGTTAQAIARGFKDVINTAISSVASNISGLIRGTVQWKDALVNIGSTVLDTIIQSIVKMGLQWVTTHASMETISTAFHGLLRLLNLETSAQAAATTAAQTPGLATNAALATVGSYGAALATLAALGIAIAAFSGAFAAGGRPEPGKVALVGERGPELWVPDSRGTIVPNHQLGAFAGGGSSTSASNRDLNVLIHDRRAQLNDWARTSEGENILVDVMGRNMHRFRT